MGKIMVPIDFSENSILALEAALVIANKLKTDLRMVYIMPKGSSYAKGYSNATTPDEHPQDKLTKLVSDFAAKYTAGGKFDFYIGEGNIAEELINKAKYDETTMIVTGSHGVSGFTQSWIGGNAYKLICNAKCPVLVIRQGMEHDNSFSRMAIPLNISKASRRKMPQATRLAKIFNAKTILVGMQSSSILSIYYRISTAIKQVERYMRDNGVEVESTTMLKGKDNIGKLFEVIATKRADLVVVEAENTGAFFADRFRPELTSVINSSPCPVLVIPVEYK
ncbi:MAG: universal stress protein [Bacteroidales bacterium]|nr:universal stress protein [Bacteroidales bacterium]MDD7724435.1 universal stress protein [Bacteroidales bacterium]MDY4173680.1 universal stress protein [Bacteroidales bacterium]